MSSVLLSPLYSTFFLPDFNIIIVGKPLISLDTSLLDSDNASPFTSINEISSLHLSCNNFPKSSHAFFISVQ